MGILGGSWSRRIASRCLRWGVRIALTAVLTATSPGLSEPHHPADGDTATYRQAPSQPVAVGLNKSVLIDLPEDVAEVIISNPVVVEAVVHTARRVHLLGRQTGQASATFIAHDGRVVLTLDVAVERDLSQAADMIHRLMPEAQVRLEMVNDNVVLTGTVTNPLDATRAADIASRFVAKREQVLNLLNVDAKEQVLLRVTVAEMNRGALRRLGVDIKEVFASGGLKAVKVLENALPVTGGMIPGALYDAVAGTLATSGSGATLAASIPTRGGRIDAIIQALEREGLARTLAEPSLTSLSGETADFLAGGEYPVPTGSDKDGTTITFKQFGVGLKFTPVVLSAGRISLKVATEVSELTSEGAVTVNSISIPALKMRRASSTLELPSGGAVVMAGLLSQQTRRSAEGLPGLKDLPVLGTLFRSDDFIRAETELVVIVTPYLVRAVPRDALRTPGEEAEAMPATPQPEAPRTAHLTAADFGFIVE